MPISSDPDRILIICPAAPAELCFAVPLAPSLRRAFPDAAIHWMVRESTVPMLAAHPAIDEVIALPDDLPRPRRWRRGLLSPPKVREQFRKLRDQGYDLVIDAVGRGGSGRFARATGAPRRIGSPDAAMIERLMYTARPETAGAACAPMHEVERTLELLRPLEIDSVFDMRLFLRGADARWWAQRRSECGLDGASGTYAVIAPATSRPGKRWPIERWAELLGPLLHRHMHRIVLIGRASDHERLRPLRELAATFRADGDSPLIDLVGETDVGRMMAVIASAGLVIANDTAPLHLAAALDRPCLGLYGPTDPALTGPFRQPDAVLRVFRPRPGEIVSPTDPKLGDALMRVISTAAVIQAIDRVMPNASRAMNDQHVEHAPSPIGTEGGRP